MCTDFTRLLLVITHFKLSKKHRCSLPHWSRKVGWLATDVLFEGVLCHLPPRLVTHLPCWVCGCHKTLPYSEGKEEGRKRPTAQERHHIHFAERGRGCNIYLVFVCQNSMCVSIHPSIPEYGVPPGFQHSAGPG
jgi:hypothetical protein